MANWPRAGWSVGNPTTPHWLPPAPPLLILGGESFLDDLHFRMFASTARSLANVLFHAC